MQNSVRNSVNLRRGRCGFTLVESLLGLSLMSLLFLGAMSLYGESLRVAVKADAQLTSNATAANGLLHVERDVREAYYSVLPSTTPAPNPAFGADLGTGYARTLFQTTYFDPSVGADRTIDTGLKLVFPATKTASVFNSSGAQITPPQYDVSTGGAVLYVYRADLPANLNTTVPATPDPSLGDCLWASGSEGGTPVNLCLARLSDSRKAASGIDASNTIPNAVEFIKPPEPNSIEIRLISSYFSPISNSNDTLASQQSNESNKTLLSGKCVYMHDHQQKSN